MENKVITGVCTDLNHQGMGVVKDNGIPIFVSNLLIGEKAQIRIDRITTSYMVGTVIKRENNASNRVTPKCSKFMKCGGCDLMHMDYSSQLAFKLKMVNETFKRIGHLDFSIKEIIKAENPYHYRNKVQIPYKKVKDKVICGFYKKKSHDIVEVSECYIQPNLMTDISRFVKNLLNEYKIEIYDEVNHKGIFRQLLLRKTSSNEYMIVFVVKEKKIPNLSDIVARIISRYQEVKTIIMNINDNPNNTILSNKYEVLYGDKSLIETILGLKFKMSHNSFFQINHEQTEVLYNKVLELANVKDKDTVLDCFCGVGTISLLAAKKANKVIGIEVVKEAINNAIDNARLNNIKNCKFILGKAEEEINNISLDNIDIMIVDPPRKGLEKSFIDVILSKNIKRIVYVSCDVGTMARDLHLLQEKYELKKGSCVDLFPETADVESVVYLEHK